MKKVLLILTCCIYLATQASAQTEEDTIHVYFDLGIPTLNVAAMQHLDSLAYYNIIAPKTQYGIIGYADYLGGAEYNIELSQNRANAVQEYLQGLGVKAEDIETVVGKGEINRDMTTSEGYPTDRRVDIILGGFKEPVDSAKYVCRCGKPNCSKGPFVKEEKPKPIKGKIDIQRVKKNETIALENLYFLPGRHVIREESETTLFDLYITMKDNPTLKINIEGHICCLKNTSHDGYDYDTREFKLSENRAKTVYTYLVEHGISAGRMNYQGFGIKKPLKWPERSLADENMNRRVEIRVVDK